MGPVPPRAGVLSVFDEGLRGAKIVYFGSGKNTLTLEVEFDRLLAATGGRLYPIVCTILSRTVFRKHATGLRSILQ